MDALRSVIVLMFALDDIIAAYGRQACVAVAALIVILIVLSIYRHRGDNDG